MAVGLVLSLSTAPPGPVRVIPVAVQDLECSALTQETQLATAETEVLVVPGPGGVATVTLPVAVGIGRSGLVTASGDAAAVARILEGVGWSCSMAPRSSGR